MMRRVLVFIVMLVIVVGAAMVTLSQLKRPRESGARMIVETRLRHIAQAHDLYQRTHGRVPPALKALVTDGLLTAADLDGFADGGGFPIVAYQAVPSPAVAAGEPWGGPGETAAADVPAARIVFIRGSVPTWYTESAFQKTLLPMVQAAGKWKAGKPDGE